ncbi:putative cyclic nucleotide-gated ion channel 7 [Prunus avium]|uniref:Cyclic nucleotide-gated ion channel 7 n=1 Tax=Prunus avium TaxID=42229 RepID=A0A6P5RDW9_PRUAV|nr:putative cyclic nucleotide-gated ion channel 7 [Prunus avium]
MGKEELETISEDLQPKIFQENDTVVEAGQPLHSMLFIISGTMQAYVPIRDAPREAARTKTFEKGMFFGEQLLDWAVKTKTFDDQPPSDKTVRCSTKVEAFALTVDDLKTLVKTGKLKMRGEV